MGKKYRGGQSYLCAIARLRFFESFDRSAVGADDVLVLILSCDEHVGGRVVADRART